ncbi:MAG: hypothetical protein ABSH06_30770, partial [Thermodesulfobacteriota bacterium]
MTSENVTLSHPPRNCSTYYQPEGRLMEQRTSREDVPNVIVVDDTPANLQLLTGMLKERGYKVRPVPSGK